jgi:hypothetical protein
MPHLFWGSWTSNWLPISLEPLPHSLDANDLAFESANGVGGEERCNDDLHMLFAFWTAERGI